MKKILLFIFLLILCPLPVYADHIYNINMDIYLSEDGTASITEVWDVKADSGSEWYKQMYNLGNQELSDFTVIMDDAPMTYKEWDVNETMSQKKGYYGINRVPEGLELCFGKGDMSRHTFTLKYKLSNFITNTTSGDSQILYQTLFPNVTLDSFKVNVSSFYEFPDTLDVWGYGGQYLAYVKDGKIVVTSDTYSLNNDYVTILAKFPAGTFNTDNMNGNFESFDEVYETAEDGTFEYDYSYKPSLKERIMNFLAGLTSFIFPLGIFALVIGAALKSGYGYKDNKTIDKKNVPMFRDIPCNKDIYYANALINLNNFGYKETNIFGAIILKWLRQDKIAFKNETKGIFNKETSMIDLTLNPTFDSDIEKELFDIMYKASEDGLLESKELERWAKKHYEKFLGIFKRITNYKIDELKANNHIYKRTSKEECKRLNVMDDMIYKDSTELYGLKKFLQEFSDMKNKEAIEVKLWDEYLMFAYLFGMAEKVAKQFKDLYPEIVREMEQSNLDYGTFVYINNISTRSVNAASAARQAAESYSSGGGGFSSGGGGGGSFGGGGSMGGR